MQLLVKLQKTVELIYLQDYRFESKIKRTMKVFKTKGHQERKTIRF